MKALPWLLFAVSSPCSCCPETFVRDLAGAQVGNDRAMIRSLINMLVWNLVAVIVVVTL